MSLFLSLNSLRESDVVDPVKMEMANIQYEAMAANFSVMMAGCRKKCIPSEYGETELTKGEMTCVDRCVKKFMKLNLMIAQTAQRLNFQPLDIIEYKKLQNKEG